MKKIIYLGVLLTFVFLSCNNEKEGLPTQKLKKDISIKEFSDSTFFSDIRSLFFYKDKFFASDYKRDNIFILDKNLKLEKTIGNKGRGPGELLGASQLFLYQDSIFIINDQRRTIDVFGYNNHLKTIKMPLGVDLHSAVAFSVYNDKILLSNCDSISSIASLSLKSDSVVQFGKLKQFRTPKETRIKNERHISVMGDRIIAIPDCQPNIEVYDMEGKLLLDYEFGDIELIKNLLRFTKSKKQAINSYYLITEYSYVYENKIFILTTSVDENDRMKSNTIIQFEMVDDKISPKKIFDLGNGWFNSFCVTGEKILTFNASNPELILYNYE